MCTNTAFFRFNKYPMAVVLLAFILASCGGHKEEKKKDPAPQPTQLSVAPLYPTNGADWNDYVSGNDWKTAPDIACDAYNDTACMHGGELRVVVATGQSSCSGLTASDDLAAFKWVCDASTGTPRMVSTGLADGKNLSDLIDFTGGAFKPNKVTVYLNGSSWNTTPSTVWWNNPVEINNSGGNLTTASTVYLVTSNLAADITLFADKIAVVVEPGVTITGPGAGGNVITSNNYPHFWLEGNIDASGYNYGVSLTNLHFSMLRNLKVDHGTQGGVVLDTAVHNTIMGVTANNTGGTGVYLTNVSKNNIITNVTASNNSVNGVNLYNASNNTLRDVMASNNGSNGVYLNTASNNTLMDVTASNNIEGVYLNTSSNNSLAGVTASNNTDGVYLNTSSNNNNLSSVTVSNNVRNGVYINNASSTPNYNTLTGVTSSNNNVGVYVFNSSSNTFADVTSGNNNLGVYLYNSSSNTFTGLLKVGNTSQNCIANLATAGLDSSTCANNGSSDASLTTDITLANSFVGKVSSDDVANASDASGTASFPADPAVFDWTHFDNRYRGWGLDGSVFPTYADQTGKWISGTGRIWDWSLLSTDAVDKGVLSPPTGDDTMTHTWSDASSTTFLRNAVEIAGDGIGNDNGLCESGETCRYTPNIGSYQGSGDLVSAGAFTGGSLTGITLMKYATNGE